MNKTAKIQIPIDFTLKVQAEQLAAHYGYSSLQEVIRVFLSGFVSKAIQPTFVSTPDEVLTYKEAKILKNKVDKVKSSISKDNIYTAKSGEDIIKLAKKVR